MVTLEELVIGVSFFWLLVIVIANRVNLQQYHLLVSSGFLLYIPEIFTRFLHRIAGSGQRWKKWGHYALLPTLVLFLTVPLVLSINLIQGFFFNLSPIFKFSLVEILRVETFLLILPVLGLFLSIQMIITAVFDVIDGKEISRAGLLLVGVVLTFFAQSEDTDHRPERVKAISLIVIAQLVVVLLAGPASAGIQAGLSGMYEESQGAIVTVIYPNSPAAASNFDINDVITQVRVYDGSLVIFEREITSGTLFRRTLAQIPPGTELHISTQDNRTLIQVGIVPPPEVSPQQGSYLGLEVEDYRPAHNDVLPVLLPFWIGIFFDWLINIGLLFGVYSLLPLPKSAGLTLLNEINEKFNLDLSSGQTRIVSYGSLAILVANVIFFVI